MEPLLSITNLTAGYGTPIVHEASFSLYPGEIVGLLGRNGSGKTTLLRGLTGAARVYTGQVLLCGQDGRLMTSRQRAKRLSLLSQRTEVLPGLRVREVIGMGRYAHSGPFGSLDQSGKKLVQQIACRFGIDALLDTDCAALSEGQRQLVHLARVMVQDAPVLLLDEPNSALDFENTHRLFFEVNQMIDEENRAALVVLHDPSLALRWCDRLFLMDNGRLSSDLSVRDTSEEDLQTFLRQLYPVLSVIRDEKSGVLFCSLP